MLSFAYSVFYKANRAFAIATCTVFSTTTVFSACIGCTLFSASISIHKYLEHDFNCGGRSNSCC